MRRKLVVGNWKMHGNLAWNEKLLQEILKSIGDFHNADFAVCVPHPYLFQAQNLLHGTNLKWGSQNVFREPFGAFTGAVSATMVADFGCTYTIIGHSERRGHFRETTQSAAKSIKLAINAGLIPIYCMGETPEEHAEGHARSVVGGQIDGVLDTIGAEMLSQMELAYEPTWAIGTGKTATPEQAQTMHTFIRHRIAKHDEVVAEKVRILYGGSVKPANAAQLLAMPDIDGGLVGGASLNAEEFVAICRAANMLLN